MLTLRKNKNQSLYQAPEYKQFLILRLLSLAMLGVLLLGVFFTIWFIRQNIYDTISQAEILILKQNGLVTEVIDFEKYEKIKKLWQLKTAPPELDIARDPFHPAGLKITEGE